MVSIGYVVYKGVLNAPEGSDSDKGDDSHDDGSSEGHDTEAQHDHPRLHSAISIRLRLSHTAGSIADAFDLSGTVLGATVLSFHYLLYISKYIIS